MKEEVTEVFVNSKDTMAVLDMNQFKGHAGGMFHGIFIATGRTETTMTAERNKLEVATVCTAEHGTAERRIATMDHFIHVFNNRSAWM